MKKLKKKSESQYISWVLIFGLMIMLSYFLFNWTMEQAKKTSEQIESYADPLVCSEVGFSIEGMCQNSNKLIFNVSNNNLLEINGFIIKTIGLYPEDNNYLGKIEILKYLYPNDKEEINVLKNNLIKSAEIVAITKKGKKYVYCEEKFVNVDNIKYC